LFVDITPEDSLYGPAFGLPSSSVESLRVSSNSSWTFDGAEPSSLQRYLRNHERHEKIALSMPHAPNRCHKRLLNVPADGVDSPFDTEATLPGDYFPNPDIPMHRYLADDQPHERRALDLEQEDNQQRHTQTKSSDREPQSGESSISLSDGPGIAGEGDDMYAPRGSIPQGATDNLDYPSHKRQRARAANPLRRHKSTKVRKRHSVSPAQGHRDKLAKRC
jgi:hypothetical protein